MSSHFAGKVAIVTGASSGIGWELARQIAAHGAKVGLFARRFEQLERLAVMIRDSGGTACVVPADVSDYPTMKSATGKVRANFGPIDIMIANAGVGMPTTLDPVNVVDVETTFRVNVLGVVNSFAAVMPDMISRRSGQLAAVSSLAGFAGLPGESAYCASKAAVNVYLDGLRAHLRGSGITVTTLCPGFVTTPMTAANTFHMPGLLSAEEAARRMLWAIERGRSVYSFPFFTAMLMKMLGYLPDWAKVRIMADYNAENSA